MFPISNNSGKVIAFGGRILGDGQPKYLNSPETSLFLKSKQLYGIFNAKNDNQIRDLIEEDIYWKKGIWTYYDVYPWVQAF